MFKVRKAAAAPQSQLPFLLASVMCIVALLPGCSGVVRHTGAAGIHDSVLLDDFDRGLEWFANASDGAYASVHHVAGEGVSGGAMRLDFDFKGGSGYAAARRPLQLRLSEDYRFSFDVRGDGSIAKLEVKLVDASGNNVWWKTFRDFEFTDEWQDVNVNKREIRFAWGPTDDKILREAAFIEFVVVASEVRGSGFVLFDDLTFKKKEAQPVVWERPNVKASSGFLPGNAPHNAFDNDKATAWRSLRGGEQTLTLDFGRVREFGALIFHWEEGGEPERIDMRYSDDGVNWRLEKTLPGKSGRQILYLKDSESQYVQLRFDGPEDRQYALQELAIKGAESGDSLNALIFGLASEAPRGTYPRAMLGEQSYWTVVGTDGGTENGLISEDGAVEVGRGMFSLEPFVITGDYVATWADVDISHSLLESYLPIPSVSWQHKDWQLRITSIASGDAIDAQLATRYELVNLSNERREFKLAVAARPFQVNSPEQVLNTPGGVATIEKIVRDDSAIVVNDSRRVQSLTPLDDVVLSTVSSGAVPELLRAKRSSKDAEIVDSAGLAAATFLYELSLQPGAAAQVVIATPLTGSRSGVIPTDSAEAANAWFEDRLLETSNYWRMRLNNVEIRTPPSGQRVVDTMRSSLAHILISRNGIKLRPGTRNYGHSWIRDGAMISESLLRMGVTDIPTRYARWFAPHQFENGKVPCCISKNNLADPVPENDSHGQLIFLIAEIYRYTGDEAFVKQLWPNVKRAVDYMDQMRRNEQREENQRGDRKILYGLLEPSISHEGYPVPAYSNWDNFWGLKGYSDAVELARALGYSEDEDNMRRSRDEFRKDLYNSIRGSATQHGIDYIAGAAELGDFDATSTTIALAPGGERGRLPEDLLLGTFDRYWHEFVARRDGEKDWAVYTPYEVRAVSSFVRLGWRNRAHDLLDYFLADRRPESWNQWAEVVGNDKRHARFIGDMPHAWISSDYIRSALDLFAFRRERDEAIILAAGIPIEWLSDDGIALKRLQTGYGELSYTLFMRNSQMALNVELRGKLFPPGGLVFPLPSELAGVESVTINGNAVQISNGDIVIREPEAQVIVNFST